MQPSLCAHSLRPSVSAWGCSPGTGQSVGKRHAQTASGTKTEQKHRADIQGPLSWRLGICMLVLLLGGSRGSLQPTGLLAATTPSPADAAGVVEAVTDGVVVLLPAWTLGGQQYVHGIQAVQTPGRGWGAEWLSLLFVHPGKLRPRGGKLAKVIQWYKGKWKSLPAWVV